MAIEMTAAPDVTARNVEGQGAIETIVSHEPDQCAPVAQFINPQQQFALGWDIFPMGPNAKGVYPVPWSIAKGWRRLDADSVDRYWPGGSTQHFNVGVATGARSGVWVLDVDRVLEEESEAREYVAEWTGIEIPDTLSVKTASGKWHFYFAMPEDPTIYVKNSRGALGDLIDVRGDGGMVMGICSAVVDEDGERNHYRVVRMMRPAQAPDELIERVKRRETPRSEIVPASIDKDVNAAADAIAAGWIEEELQRLRDLPRPWVAGSGWHDTCFEVACKLSEFANSAWCSLTLEDAQRRYFEAAPGVERDWNPATEWREGVQKTEGQARKMPNVGLDMSWFDDVPTKGEQLAQAKEAVTSEIIASGQMIDRPSEWPITFSHNWSGSTRKKARRIVRDFVPVADGLPVLMLVNDVWHYWNASHWVRIETSEVNQFVSNVLDQAVEVSEDEDGPKAAATSSAVVNDLVNSGLAHELRQHIEPGQVIGAKHHGRMIGTANGVVAIGSHGEHTFTASSPRFFNLAAGSYDYDPAATCSVWQAWLATTFAHDPKAIDALQEWFGAILLADPSLVQKMFWLIGPKRSGKGTIQGIARKMVGGAANTALRSLAGNFTKESLIGHSLAIIDDSRDPRRDEVDAVVEFLLSYTTGVEVAIQRKNRGDWNGSLRQSLLAASNTPPRLADEGSALASRMEVIQTRVSMLGHEDVYLQDRLASELPGILNWSLDGLARLVANGFKFTQADAAARVRQDVESSGTGAGAFVDDLTIEGGVLILSDLARARDWWTANDSESGHPPNAKAVTTAIRSKYPDALDRQRVRLSDGSRPKCWKGIQLRCTRCEQETPAVTVSEIHGPLCAFHLIEVGGVPANLPTIKADPA